MGSPENKTEGISSVIADSIRDLCNLEFSRRSSYMDDLNGAGVRCFVYFVEELCGSVALGVIAADPVLLDDLAPVVRGVLLKEVRTNGPA